MFLSTMILIWCQYFKDSAYTNYIFGFIIMQPTIQTCERSNIRLLANFRIGFFFFGLLTELNCCVVGGVNFSFLFLGVALGNHWVNACQFSIIIISKLQWFQVWPLFPFSNLIRGSEWFPVVGRIISPTYHLVSVWSWQTFQAWPGMMLLAKMMLCLNLDSSFAFFA